MRKNFPATWILSAIFNVGLTGRQCAIVAAKRPSLSSNNAPSSGLTFHLYENAALAGTPSVTGTTHSAELSFSFLSSAALKQQEQLLTKSRCHLSGELVGTAVIARDGVYTFECQFDGTSTGWVWMDGHLVCGDGHAYAPNKNNMAIDNPLFVRTQRQQAYPFRVHITRNDTTNACEHSKMTTRNGDDPNVKVYWKRTDLPPSSPANASMPLMTVRDGEGLLDDQFQLMAQDSGNVKFQPSLSPPEQKREELQRSLKQGWGYWLRKSILSIVKLPEGAVVELSICQKSTKQCLDTAIPDSKGIVRVGLHAYDRSYIGYNLTFQGLTLVMECSVSGRDQNELQFLITAVECNKRHCTNDFELHIGGRYAWFSPGNVTETPAGLLYTTPGLGTTMLTTVFDSQSQEHATERNVASLKTRHLMMSNENTHKHNQQTAMLNISFTSTGLGMPKIGFTVGMESVPSLPKMEATIQARKFAEKQRITSKFGNKAAVAEAIQASVMWTLIFCPVENGPFMPVSRWDNWDGNSGFATKDWAYIIFDWDNFFASLLAGLDNRDIAYSNLFQVVKSKTAAGFIPNWSTAGVKSQDRTEPPVGAKVLLELYRKYQDKWVVEALFDDLMDWNDWFAEKRVMKPLGLIGLGSYWEGHSPSDNRNIKANNMQCARWESGLDNSPMYDGDMYDNTTHMMQMYDVGMSSLFVQEAYSLSILADIIGKDPKIVSSLRVRGDAMRNLIQQHLWDPKQEAFVNRLALQDVFVQHVTPTSFYPMAIGAGTDDQDQMMAQSWLLNASRFCLSPRGDFEGNDPEKCYWGLPSISADDPTYMQNKWVYWRGYTWGPMSQLVYWSLQSDQRNAEDTDENSLSKGSNSNSVAVARKSLCKQMEALLMSQWEANKHICENYSPYKNAPECSGTLFYHWGALNGLISMVEDGHW